MAALTASSAPVASACRPDSIEMDAAGRLAMRMRSGAPSFIAPLSTFSQAAVDGEAWLYVL